MAEKFQCCLCLGSFEEAEITQVQSKDSLCSTTNQRRCKGCNATKSRITRALKHLTEEHQCEYREISSAERKDLYKKAQALCGPDLQKEMTETITSTMVRRMTDTLTTEGGFEPIDEVTDKWKTKRPTMLENLLERAPRMTCTMTQAELIWVPTYSAKHTTETMHEETRKRKLESETKIRKMKAVKNEKPDSVAVALQAPGDSGERLKGLSPAQLKSIAKLIERVETKKMNLVQTMVQAEAPDMSGYVPTLILAQFRGEMEKLDKAIDVATEMGEKKFGTSSSLKALAPTVKASLAQLEKLDETLGLCLESKA